MLIPGIDPWKLIKLGLIDGSNFQTNYKDARQNCPKTLKHHIILHFPLTFLEKRIKNKILAFIHIMHRNVIICVVDILRSGVPHHQLIIFTQLYSICTYHQHWCSISLTLTPDIL